MFSLESICLIWMLAYSCLWNTVHGETHSQIGDVRIHLDEYKWQCDHIECPPATHRCHVSKRKLRENDDHLWRTNICYSKDNVALKSHVIRQPIKSNVKADLIINSYRSGAISTYNTISAASHAFQSSNFFKSSMPRIVNSLYADDDDVAKEFVLPPIPPIHLPHIPVIPSIHLPHIPQIPQIHIPEIPPIHIPEIPPIHIPDIPQIHMPNIPEMPAITIPDIPDVQSIVMPRFDFSPPNIDNIFHSGF